MPNIERSALVNHSAEQMFDLVNDVASYPEYMQGCLSARVVSEDSEMLLGELTLGRAGVEFTFKTRNRLHRPERIVMELDSGEFREFEASWIFEALNDEASKVTLKMNFEFASNMIAVAAGPLFSSVANAQVDAIVNRAQDVYGNN